jgi:hypothetical protein
MQLTLAVRRDFLRPQAILFREPHTDNDTLSLTHKATPTVSTYPMGRHSAALLCCVGQREIEGVGFRCGGDVYCSDNAARGGPEA